MVGDHIFSFLNFAGGRSAITLESNVTLSEKEQNIKASCKNGFQKL